MDTCKNCGTEGLHVCLNAVVAIKGDFNEALAIAMSEIVEKMNLESKIYANR